jgi:hypothetical protein
MSGRLITCKLSLRTRRHGLALGIAIVLFLVLNVATLKDGQKWYPDGFQYMIHAKNLLSGQDYAAGIVLKRHFAIFGQGEMLEKYPVGFPLILAPIIWLTGMNLWFAKIPGVVFWAAWCLAAYTLISRRFGARTALLGTLFLLFSPYFFIYKQEIRPDAPFLFFLTCAISSYESWVVEPSKHQGRFIAFLLFTTISFFIIPKPRQRGNIREQEAWWDRRLACLFNDGQDARPTEKSPTRLTGHWYQAYRRNTLYCSLYLSPFVSPSARSQFGRRRRVGTHNCRGSVVWSLLWKLCADIFEQRLLGDSWLSPRPVRVCLRTSRYFLFCGPPAFIFHPLVSGLGDVRNRHF